MFQRQLGLQRRRRSESPQSFRYGGSRGRETRGRFEVELELEIQDANELAAWLGFLPPDGLAVAEAIAKRAIESIGGTKFNVQAIQAS